MNSLVPQKALLDLARNRTPGSLVSISSTGRRHKAISRTRSSSSKLHKASSSSTGAKRSSSRSRTGGSAAKPNSSQQQQQQQSRSTGHARDKKHRGRSRERTPLVVGVGAPSPKASASSSSSLSSSGQKKKRSLARSEPPVVWRQGSQANRKKTPTPGSDKTRNRTPKNQDRFIPNRARTVVRMNQVRAEVQGVTHEDELDTSSDTQTFSSSSISSSHSVLGSHSGSNSGLHDSSRGSAATAAGPDEVMDDLTNTLSGFGINSSSASGRLGRSNSITAADSRSRSRGAASSRGQVDENADPQTNSGSGHRSTNARSRSRNAAAGRSSNSRGPQQLDEAEYSPAHSRSASAAKRAYRENLDRAVGMAKASEPMLCFSNEPPQEAPMRSAFDEVRKIAGDSRPSVRRRKLSSMTPFKILDAPEICDDYFSNLLAWSEKNVVAIALRDTIYLWNATGGEIWPLPQTEADYRFPEEDWIYSAVHWLDGGTHLTTARYGRYDGAWRIDVWLIAGEDEGPIDPANFRKLRTMQGKDGGREKGRIGALAWSVQMPTVVFAANDKGDVCLHDLSIEKHFVAMLRWHEKDSKLCGLEFNDEQNLLASGGGDNAVAVWDIGEVLALMEKPLAEKKVRHVLSKPKFKFEQAKSATKALSWCPWQKNLLAVGSGMEDPAVRFYDCNNGQLLQSVRMKAQVTGLVFSPHNTPGEIVSSHGGPENSVIVWSYPEMTMTAELPGHGQSRVIAMRMDAHGGRAICTAGADESLKFWTVFEEAKSSSRPVRAMEYSRRFSNSVSIR